MTQPPLNEPRRAPSVRIEVKGESLDDCEAQAHRHASQFFGERKYRLVLIDATLDRVVQTGTGASSFVTFACEFVAWELSEFR